MQFYILFVVSFVAQARADWISTYNAFSGLQEWYETIQNEGFNPLRWLGGNGQWFPGPNVYNINSSPPAGCSVDRAVYVLRHGSRYPDPSAYQQWQNLSYKIHNATFTASDQLAFLPSWYPVPVTDADISDESLTGYRELYDLGVSLRIRYPSFYTPSNPWVLWANDYPRVVQSAQLIARGYLGPNSTTLGTIYAINSTNPLSYGDSLSPSDLCPTYFDSSGATQVATWSNIYLPPIVTRLNALISVPLNLTSSDIDLFPYLCGFESSILGTVSPFCSTFTPTEFTQYEYQQDLRYYYGQGPGSGGNQTFMFPFLNAVTSFLANGPNTAYAPANFTPPSLVVAALNDGQISQLVSEIGVFDDEAPLPSTYANASRTYFASRFVSMRGTIAFERLNCGASSNDDSETYVRVRLNDAVYPVAACQSGPGRSCPTEQYQSLIESRYNASGGFTANCGTMESTEGRNPVTTFFVDPEGLGSAVRAVVP